MFCDESHLCMGCGVCRGYVNSISQVKNLVIYSRAQLIVVYLVHLVPMKVCIALRISIHC